MEKESFSIDDIINETKRKKKEASEKAEHKAEPEKQEKPETPAEVTAEANEAENEIIEEAPDTEEAQEQPFSIEVKNEDKSVQQEKPEEPMQIVEEPIEEAKVQESSQPDAEEKSEEKADEKVEEADDTADNSPVDESAEGEMVDLLSYDETKRSVVNEVEEPIDEPKPERERKPKKKRAKKERTKGEKISIAVIIILIIAIIVAAGYYFLLPYLNMSDRVDRGENSPINTEWTGMKDDVRNFPEIEETDAGDLASLQDMIKTWYQNGAPCSASHVLNVLLIGEDTRGTDILEEETRADSAIIVSVNIDTETITMASILRDAYAYWQVTPGDEETGDFGKINGSMAMENCTIETYIDTIEHLYKIDIDNYVIVNFDCFASIIDELGGVTIEMTSAEINEINNNPYTYGDIGDVYIEKTFDGNEGEVDLDGKQALAYCRIRHLDSDNMRAERQKKCLNQMFLKVKDASNTELLKLANTLAPYVKTGFTTKEITQIARYALSNDWKEFDVRSATVPFNRINEKGAGGVYFGAWCWKADYPADAYFMQTLLYGESSITLAQNRVDVLKCREKGYFSDGLSSILAAGNSIYNLQYGEVTTYDVTSMNDEEDENLEN